MSSAFRGAEEGYASSEEHVRDALEWLDLTLLLHVLAFDGKDADPARNARGLVVSQREIAEIFSPPADVSDSGEYAEILERRAALEERIARKTEKSGVFLALPSLARAFGLSDFERKCAVICFAYAIDGKYEKIYAFLQEDVTRKTPTVELVTGLLCGDSFDRAEALRYFSGYAPFCRLALSRDALRGGGSFASLPLSLDHAIVSFLLGNRALDARMARFASLETEEGAAEADGEILPYAGQVKSRVEKFGETGGKTVLCVSGPRGSGKERFARQMCGHCGVPVLLIGLSRVSADMPLDTLFLMAERQGVLHGAAVCFSEPEALTERPDGAGMERAFARACADMRVPAVFILSENEYAHLFTYEDVFCVKKTFAVPPDSERAELFSRYARAYALKGDVNPAAFAAKYRFTAGQIETSLAKAARLAELRPGADKSVGSAELTEACGLLSHGGLEQFGQRVVSARSLGDIVLPPDALAQLKAIRDHVNYRHVVYGKWGLGGKRPGGDGLSALFFGPSGTW